MKSQPGAPEKYPEKQNHFEFANLGVAMNLS